MALGFAALVPPIAASAQIACESYTVKAGDTLAGISETAYGSRDYQIIFNANRNVIAGNPNNLAPGIVLNLPCADGRLNASPQFDDIVQREEEKAAKITPRNDYEPPIRLLAGNDWAPCTG
ncbi:LysM peptidoglycan-binding domain-containing protein [Ruegeria arenilitoris]|uniref:LysM peptidoglycan-binding domain-containing protein n=1 Tax=Ruegeria arenilitoris TaxID=1173585 RepID=UPI00147EAD76|nr:LysM peptidoglycan-binding domain-containing protein [Ruegeria arenilitoris]